MSPDTTDRIYPQYVWQPGYNDVPMKHAGFAIIAGRIENRPAVCIKLRDGRRGSPYHWDLPGGGVKDHDNPDKRAAAVQEAFEEVNVHGQVVAAIGDPLYLPAKEDGVLQAVDCAAAFLIKTTDIPTEGDEALAVAFTHQKSFDAFRVVGRKVDPAGNIFGRMPIMIFDGLSILQAPFYYDELTTQIRDLVAGDLNSSNYLLVDGGRYFGRVWTVQQKQNIQLFHRLNPDQPDGRFKGALENL